MTAQGFDVAAIRHGLETDGIIALKGAFPVSWVQQLREDIDAAFEEVWFDTPLPGATLQPWHGDSPSPAETRDRRTLTSLAFNVTNIDTTDTSTTSRAW